MLFALRKASRQPQAEAQNHPPSFPNSQGAEQHPDFPFFLFRRIRKKVVNANKPERREFRINLLRPKKWSELCVAANARVKKNKEKKENLSPLYFWPTVLVGFVLQARRNINRLPFRVHDSQHTLVCPQLLRGNGGQSPKETSEKEINFLSTSFPWKNNDTRYVALPLKLISQISLGPAHP